MIDFPKWATITRCDHRSQTISSPSQHGQMRFVARLLTEHGRIMAGYRARELARAVPVEPVHRTMHRGRRLSA